ncbi:MAG: response regulator, partial [Bacteroidota bacterium]
TSNIELVEQILLLQRSGIRLVSDIHGMQALPLAIEHSPDIIFLDLNLPDIHGIEVLRLLQSEEKTRSIPVIIISADAMPHQLEKLLQAGAEDYLTKPLDIILLLSIIDKWIE